MNFSNLSRGDVADLVDRLQTVLIVAHTMEERTGFAPRINLSASAAISMPVFDAAPIITDMTAQLAAAHEAAAHDPAPAIAPVSADCTGGVGGASRVEKPETPRYHASAPAAGPSSPWTDEDDATLVEAVLESVRAGKSIAAGYALAGDRLSRSVIACQTRGKQKLAERIRVAIADAGLVRPQPGKAPAPCRGNIRMTEIIGKAEAAAIMRDREAGMTIPQLAAKWERTTAEVNGLIQRNARRADPQPEPDRSRIGAEEPVTEPSKPAADQNPIKTEVRATTAEISEIPETPAFDQEPARKPASPASTLIMPHDHTLLSARRDMRTHLNLIGNPGAWDPETDLDLAEALAQGTKLPQIAADLGLDTQACKARWERLTGRIRDDKGRVSIDGQAHLLAELRARVQAGRAA